MAPLKIEPVAILKDKGLAQSSQSKELKFNGEENIPPLKELSEENGDGHGAARDRNH
jgi:hypothetical protein